MSIYKYSGHICCLLIVAACAKQPPAKATTVPVKVAQATRISAPLTIQANGVVEPLQTVQVQAQVNGTLQSVAFKEGDDVRAGQVLFRIDPRPYDAALRQAEATLARDQAQAASAQRDADRYKALVAKDYVTKSQADQAQAAAEALQATVQADKAAVDNAKLNAGYTTIVAPISGRTGRLLVKAGNLVKAGSDPLVVINELRPIMVRFPVLQKDFPTLQRRSQRGAVPVRVVTADSSKVDEAGALAFLDNAVDSLTGTVTAKARFENQKDGLWPGEYVRVSVELDVQGGVTAVPSAAVLAGQDGNYVFVVKGDSAVVQPVTTGRAVGDMTTIDKGLTPGERVVVDGQSRLTPNARVDVKSANASAPGGAAATTQAGAAR